MKKIGLLHYTASPVVGGVESVMAHHARLMNEAGYKVTIIAGRGGEHHKPIQFIYLPLIDSRQPQVLTTKVALDMGQVPPDFEQLVRQIEVELRTAVANLDTLIAHNVCSLHKNLAFTAALRRVCAQPGAPHLIIWHHDLAWTTPRYQAELYNGWPWDLLREDWSEVQPTQVVVSELRRQELAQLINISPDTIHVVPSGLDTDKFLKLDGQTADLLKKLHIQQAAPRLLLPVRITRRKNIELAIRTVAAMLPQMPKTSLIITGPPGPHNPTNEIYFDQLCQLRANLGLEDRVHFLAEIVREYLPDVVIGDLYRLADALILPSREEGFGIPMLEAGLMGLPIFCSDIAPLRAIAGENATYFSPEIDPFDLAQRIINELQHHDGYQLRQHIRRQYTWDGIFQEQIKPLLE